jgi:hypothetical protein
MTIRAPIKSERMVTTALSGTFEILMNKHAGEEYRMALSHSLFCQSGLATEEGWLSWCALVKSLRQVLSDFLCARGCGLLPPPLCPCFPKP